MLCSPANKTFCVGAIGVMRQKEGKFILMALYAMYPKPCALRKRQAHEHLMEVVDRIIIMARDRQAEALCLYLPLCC